MHMFTVLGEIAVAFALFVRVESRTVRTFSHLIKIATFLISLGIGARRSYLYVSQRTPDVDSPWEYGVVMERVSLDTQRSVSLMSFFLVI